MSCTHYYKYPKHWWEPFPEEEKYSWEILPQKYKKSDDKVILSKRNELGLLSNFAATPFIFEGNPVNSLEGLWQGMKYPDPDLLNDPREKLFNKLPSRTYVQGLVGLEAWRAGREADIILKKNGINWISHNGEKIFYKGKDKKKHYEIIRNASRAKVDQNALVKEVLMETGDLKLFPDHIQDSDATDAYKYFNIYELIREEIRKEN